MIDTRLLQLIVQGDDAASPAVGAVTLSVATLGKESLSSGDKVRELGNGLASLALAAAGVPPPLAKALGSLATMSGTMMGEVAKVGDRWDKFKAKVQEGGERIKDAFKRAGDGVKNFVSSALAGLKRLGQGVVTLVKKLATIGLAILGVSFATGGLQRTFQKFFDMEGAAKLEGINAAFLAIAGEGAPAMEAALRAGSSGMVEWIDLAGRYNDATLLINKQVAEQLPEALTYLTKISLATGESMDYLLDSLVRGVGRLSPKILDNLKIQVSLAEATDYATQMFGKEADALTVTEKQMGMMAVTMTKLEAKTRGLADATGSLMALRAQHSVLQAENAKMLAGIFVPVMKSWYALQVKLASAFRKSISEGGAWYNVLRKISATISVVIDLLGELADRFSGAGGEAVDKFANKMFEAAWKAFSWGANIINNLAIGITRGAANALISAINFISNILSYWLAPGSAPKFLPKLVDWGASAFTAYLEGFSRADYNVLSGLQAPLSGALQALVGLGMMAQEEVGPMFVGLSESMAAALAEFAATGAVSTTVFEELAAIGGGYGAELEELFRRQLAVASATQAVEEAERRLVAAREKEETTGKALSKQAREYNRMLREGASAEALRAKLAEVKASYATLEDAREEAELAEQAKKDAEERAKEANRLMQLQNELLQQLIAMGQAMSEMAETDVTPPGLDPDELFPEGFTPMIESIDAAFSDLKDRIKARFMELWEDLKGDWEASGVGKLIEDLKKKWEESELKVWFEEFILDVREEGLRPALSNLWLKIESAIQGWLDDSVPWLGRIWRAFTEEGLEDGSGTVDFGAAFTTVWEEIKAGLNTLAIRFGVWLGTAIWNKLTGDGGESTFWSDLGWSFVAGLLQGFVLGIDKLWTDIETELQRFWGCFLAFFGVHSGSTKFAGLGGNLVTGLWDGMLAKIGEINWASMAETIKNAFATGLSGMGEALKGVFNSIISTVERAIDHIITGVNILIRAIRGIPGAPWIDTLSYIDFPRLARGGLITATEQLVAVHQHEVVLPLDDPRTIALMADAMRGAFGQIRSADTAPTVIHVTNHFGTGSVRSDLDIIAITNQIQRSLELRGVRGGIS